MPIKIKPISRPAKEYENAWFSEIFFSSQLGGDTRVNAKAVPYRVAADGTLEAAPDLAQIVTIESVAELAKTDKRIAQVAGLLLKLLAEQLSKQGDTK